MPNTNMTKTQWIELFRETGLDEATMRQWHHLFEQRYPAQHQAFSTLPYYNPPANSA
ncbi:MAG: hypothetical protein RL122_1253 [Pseudomonadota bacterium]|jgi:hypothetical protein|uniref:Uncharacterized protein n=1 Tax=Thiothrix fructosivorans TaxID=111770 RepID=A0A8B0SNZ5_9GAMM|nr:hypothetical protein [Thiothrix fructosivorans]MBO0613986.1 hypothetical protein [Thiothrix fructosivorans]QTX12925.1 hypothetical protein J1836_017465 [Thiothrix fructosivorans]